MKFQLTDTDPSGFFAILAGWTRVAAVWGIGVAVLTVLVHIIFAWAVYRDAEHQRTPIFVGPEIWGLATLLGGVVTAGIYWALHHSCLNQDVPIAPTETEDN